MTMRCIRMVSLSHWGMFEYQYPRIELGEFFYMPFYVEMWEGLTRDTRPMGKRSCRKALRLMGAN
jgi:hypothetical protein